MSNRQRAISRIAALIIGALALASCNDTTSSMGGGGIAPPSLCSNPPECQSAGRGSGTTTPLPAGDIPRFAYVANLTDNTLSMFLVDAPSGRLTPIGYVITGAGPAAVTTDPASQYVYVANRNDDSVSAFAVDERTGTLTEVTGSPFTVGDEPATLLVDPTGRFLYVANQTGQSISAFSINATTGALTLRETESTPGHRPTSLAVDPIGAYLFVGNSATGSNPANISSFAIDASTGALASVDSLAVGQGAIALVINPGGTRVYAVSDYLGAVAVVSVTAGNLSIDDPATVTVGSGGSGIAVAPSGAAAYVTNRTNDVVRDYAVDGTTGALSVLGGSPLDTGAGPVGVTVDPLGDRVYVVNEDSAEVSVFAIDSGNQALTAASTTRTQRGPRSLALVTRGAAAAPKAKYAYILNAADSTISAYTVNANSGVPKIIASQALAGGLGTPRALALDTFGRFVYVAHANNSVSAYRIAPTTGRLTWIATETSSVDPTVMVVEPSGRYVYVAGGSGGGSEVVVLAIDQTTGALTEVPASGIATGTVPASIAADPTGRFVYVVASSSTSPSIYTIAPGTGLLSNVPATASVDPDPRGVAVDPSGRFVYAVSSGTNRIQGFGIDASSGDLTSIPTTLVTGITPAAVVADPTGRFVYAANADADTIKPCAIDAADGTLTGLTVSPLTGTHPTALAVNPAGTFVYVTNEWSNSLATYQINQTTGTLSRVGGAIKGLSTPVAVGLTFAIE